MKSPIILIKKRTKKIHIFNCILYCYINEKGVGKNRSFPTAMQIKTFDHYCMFISDMQFYCILL